MGAFDSFEEFYTFASTALPTAGKLIRAAQLRRENNLGVTIKKNDGTYLTRIDVASQRLLVEHAGSILPGLYVVAEEKITTPNVYPEGIDPACLPPVSKTDQLLIDPGDGTTDLAMRGIATTIIAGQFHDSPNPLERRIRAAAVYEPASGRLWTAFDGNGAYRNVRNRSTGTWAYPDSPGEQIHVGTHETKGGIVIVDIARGFKRTTSDGESRTVLYANGRRSLSSLIEHAGAKEISHNSNGADFARVADGEDTPTVAHICQAIGGVWDTPYLLGVQEAGGDVASFRIEEDTRGRKLVRLKNPHDIYRADIIRAANSAQVGADVDAWLRESAAYGQNDGVYLAPNGVPHRVGALLELGDEKLVLEIPRF